MTSRLFMSSITVCMHPDASQKVLRLIKWLQCNVQIRQSSGIVAHNTRTPEQLTSHGQSRAAELTLEAANTKLV